LGKSSREKIVSVVHQKLLGRKIILCRKKKQLLPDQKYHSIFPGNFSFNNPVKTGSFLPQLSGNGQGNYWFQNTRLSHHHLQLIKRSAL